MNEDNPFSSRQATIAASVTIYAPIMLMHRSTMAMRLLYFLPTLLLLLIKVPRSQSQYSEGTSIYDRTISSGKVDLNEQIQSHPDVNLLFYPERAQLYADSYIYNYPLKSEYRISLLMDPCRFNPFDCCMNNFGSPEYPALIRSNLEVERDFQFRVIGKAFPFLIKIDWFTK